MYIQKNMYEEYKTIGDFLESCKSFNYSQYFSEEDKVYYGTPKTCEDIPYGEIYGNSEIFKRSLLGMFQDITEQKKWIELKNKGKDVILKSTPKINFTDHSNSYNYILEQCIIITEKGWNFYVQYRKEKDQQIKIIKEKVDNLSKLEGGIDKLFEILDLEKQKNSILLKKVKEKVD